MEIKIKKKSTGICAYLELDINNPKVEDLEVITKVVNLVQDYNNQQIDEA